MELCNRQMRPGSSTSETFSGIPHLNSTAYAGFTFNLINTQIPIQPSNVKIFTHKCKTSYENSLAINPDTMHTDESHSEGPFAKKEQYDNVRKRHATKSQPDNYLEESMKKRLNSKGTVNSLNNQSSLCEEDYIENIFSGCQVT
ncbi:hypothetical protein NPIL_644981 [Nephila pilipes]|uniref:Uncharacterized protein n=1 Tax=Nephila pilipes TaxID=299642 RepID=A0A8X6MGU1_NEPPI|nr:hypothetical protein NPIL_627941 [Nephila pilipes]GFT66108.1 hypothetical protein NPIL_644981 [Nephila pilipes]